jgi:hypothetical protein
VITSETLSKIRLVTSVSDGKRMKITAVHYEGDAASLAVGHHQNQGEEEGKIVDSTIIITRLTHRSRYKETTRFS